MGFWSWVAGDRTPPTPAENPGDPHGVELVGEPVAARALPVPVPSSWDGWPNTWEMPYWGSSASLNQLIDVAWAAIDLNSSVLSSMPCYRLRNGDILPPLQWMSNPDPDTYTSWAEFAKQLFWDYQAVGEAFVLPMTHTSDGFPARFRVVPGWLVTAEMRNGSRQYFLGGVGGTDITADVLHIRYQSNTADAHGHGPLEVGGARMTAAGLLQRYAQRIAETGGVPYYWMEVARRLDQREANDLLNRWVESRTRYAGQPAIVSGDASLHQAQSMSAKDMTLLELSQFNEGRIAILLGVPPHLMGLPSGDSLTYANASQWTDHHDRSSLKPKAVHVMSALSGWVLPRGQSIELNRDEYTRPPLKERAEANKIMFEAGALSIEEWRQMERLTGDAPAAALTGADMTGTSAAQPAEQEGAQNAVLNQ